MTDKRLKMIAAAKDMLESIRTLVEEERITPGEGEKIVAAVEIITDYIEAVEAEAPTMEISRAAYDAIIALPPAADGMPHLRITGIRSGPKIRETLKGQSDGHD